MAVAIDGVGKETEIEIRTVPELSWLRTVRVVEGAVRTIEVRNHHRSSGALLVVLRLNGDGHNKAEAVAEKVAKRQLNIRWGKQSSLLLSSSLSFPFQRYTHC